MDYGTRSGYVFRARAGDPAVAMATTVLARCLSSVATSLGLQAWGITLHSFRGSGALAALQAGVVPAIVMYVAGWTTEAMMDYYTQLRQQLNYDGEGVCTDPDVLFHSAAPRV